MRRVSSILSGEVIRSRTPPTEPTQYHVKNNEIDDYPAHDSVVAELLKWKGNIYIHYKDICRCTYSIPKVYISVYYIYICIYLNNFFHITLAKI